MPMKISKIEFENFRNFKDHGEIRCSTDGKVTIIMEELAMENYVASVGTVGFLRSGSL